MPVIDRQVVPVGEAARLLGVSPARVRELVNGGMLRAYRHGRELLVDRESLDRRLRVVRPRAGRPLSPRMAWAMLWVASGLRPGWVSPPELTRARRYARRDLWQWPGLLARRSDVHYVRMLPGPLRRLVGEADVVRGGVSAANAHGSELMAAESEAELYLPDAHFQRLRKENRLKLDADVSNVVLRVPRFPMSALGLDGGVMPRAVVAVDLFDSGEPRSMRAAHQLLAVGEH